jgi:hypothetical protein
MSDRCGEPRAASLNVTTFSHATGKAHARGTEQRPPHGDAGAGLGCACCWSRRKRGATERTCGGVGSSHLGRAEGTSCRRSVQPARSARSRGASCCRSRARSAKKLVRGTGFGGLSRMAVLAVDRLAGPSGDVGGLLVDHARCPDPHLRSGDCCLGTTTATNLAHGDGRSYGSDWWKRKKLSGSYFALTRRRRS